MRWSPPVLLASVCGLLVFARGAAAAGPGSVKADEQTLRAAQVGTDGPALLEFFRQRTLSEDDRAKIAALIRQLGDDSYQVREKASADLVKLGTPAVALLHQAAQDPDIEVVRRAQRCLQLIEGGQGTAVPAAAARLLARRRPAGAVEVLLTYLPFAEDEIVADELRAALRALALRDGQPDPALTGALVDKVPARRAAAAEILCQVGGPSQRRAVHLLLLDPEPDVRLRAALALAEAQDKQGIPVLIDLLAQLPRDQVWPAEDFLLRLAGDQAPAAVAGDTAAARQNYRAAWVAWWREHGPRLDLARLDLADRLLGYTLVAQMDANFESGRVVELSPDGKTRWQIDGLQYPVDVQVLGRDRVLITEHRSMRVTERDFRGRVLWEKQINLPIAAQRLPNGRTFIATRSQVVEVDRSGREVFTFGRPNLHLYAAQKLRNGQIALVSSTGVYLRLDATGKELTSFPVGRIYLYGNIDALPDGRVLVPQYATNRVVEYDAEGKTVWEARVANPTSVMRLPNGNTLVGCLTARKVVELNRQGEEVWSHQADGRPYRVRRR